MGKHILAVDDNPMMREVYFRILTAEKYEVATASDGLQALERLEAEDKVPDLILLDIEMPHMNGWELLEVLRHHVAWCDIPVIVVSGLVSPDALEAHPEYQYYVTKKETGSELLDLIEQVLAGAPEADTGPEEQAGQESEEDSSGTYPFRAAM